MKSSQHARSRAAACCLLLLAACGSEQQQQHLPVGAAFASESNCVGAADCRLHACFTRAACFGLDRTYVHHIGFYCTCGRIRDMCMSS